MKNIFILLLFFLLFFISCGSSSTKDINNTKSNEIPSSVTLTIDVGGERIVKLNETITIEGRGVTTDKSELLYLWEKGTETLATTAIFDYTPTVVGTDRLKFTVQHNSGEHLSLFVKVIVVKKNEDRVISPISEETKQHYLQVINKARGRKQDCKEEGNFSATSPLKWNDNLYKSAYEHSYDMVSSENFAHEGSGTKFDWTGRELGGKKSILAERIESYGYDWTSIGENIGAGTVIDTPEKMVQGWLDSPPHCANLMKPDFKEVGMSMIKKEDSIYTHYWTQDFGKER